MPSFLGCCPAPKCERRESAEGGNGTEPCRLSVTSTRTPSRGDSPNVPNAITMRLNTFRRRLVAPSRSVLLFNSPAFETFYSLLECSVLSRNAGSLLHLRSKGARCGRRTAASHLSPNLITPPPQPSRFVSPSSDLKSRLVTSQLPFSR